ncbi:MAG: Nif3-like dinuclear metal center hexameric protein [Clostridiales bacterium]|nr:Nif3-like dinuclear metal center hexameric protein [Clostridiales bacterium]
MATVRDVISIVEEIAPLELGKSYCERYGARDNSGLLLGDEAKPAFSVLVCLDVTSEVAAEAEDANADMIISHHPLIFDGIKSVTKSSPLGRTLYRLIKSDIAVYCAHLNFDVAPNGVAKILSDKLDLAQCKAILSVGEDAGLGRIGRLSSPMPLREFYDLVVEVLGDSSAKLCGDFYRQVSTVAVAPGSCGGDMSLLEAVYEMGADVLVTGEIKHHVALAAKELDVALIDGGHHSTEYPAIRVLVDMLSEYAEKSGLDIEFAESQTMTNPFGW